MKIKFIPLLFTFLLIGCVKETVSTNDEDKPSAPTDLTLEIALEGQISNPHGDGSGEANFKATATGAAKIDFRIDKGTAIESSNGELTYQFVKEGTHTYTVTSIAYSDENLVDSISKNVRVRVAPPSKYSMTQVWADEFDYEGALDPNKWHHQVIPILGSSWANGEQQHYTDRTENSYVSDGALKIVAKRENYQFRGVTKNYTSARLNSKYSFKYGRVDISAKLPAENGTWPALWTLGANINEVGNYFGNTYGSVGWPACGEIDIMEQNGWDKNNLIGHLHWGDTQTGAYENKGGTKAVANTATSFNLYSLVWNENEIKILFNDEVVFETENTSSMPYDNPHYILFNIAMGGNLGGTIPADFTQAVMEVDYIRIYQ